MSNSNVSLIREQIKGAHELLEGVMADVTSEQANWAPPGTANPIGATYAHVLLSQDGTVNGMLKAAAPLAASSFAGKAGVSEPPPSPNPEAPGLPDWAEWSRRVKVDVDGLRSYAQAVYAATDDYLASLSDEDLSQTIDLSMLGLGQMPLQQLLLGGVLGNTQWHTGEIACLKGLQGGRGYPAPF